jgi:hypothetical protein
VSARSASAITREIRAARLIRHAVAARELQSWLWSRLPRLRFVRGRRLAVSRRRARYLGESKALEDRCVADAVGTGLRCDDKQVGEDRV